MRSVINFQLLSHHILYLDNSLLSTYNLLQTTHALDGLYLLTKYCRSDSALSSFKWRNRFSMNLKRLLIIQLLYDYRWYLNCSAAIQTQTKILPSLFLDCWEDMRRHPESSLPKHTQEELLQGQKGTAFMPNTRCDAAAALLWALQGRKWPFKGKHFSL